MKRELTGRFIAAVLIGILSGYYLNFDYVRWSQRGREAFLAYESHRFDRFMLSPRPAIVTVFVVSFVAVVFFGLYELLAAVLLKMFDPNASNSGIR